MWITFHTTERTSRLNLLNRIILEKLPPKPLQTVLYGYITTFYANTLYPQMHRLDHSFKDTGTKKGNQESVRQISPINITKNVCEISLTECMFLLLEI